MVSPASMKKSKSTYTERVLRAFSQIQRDHKKHAIHRASLRARVKRNAQEKQDQLGPHWTSWVNKAVLKLENEGILQPARQSGSVALTPNGKKAISTARRSIRASNGSPDVNEDDLVWKQVATRSLKRSHRASHRASTTDYDSDDDVEETPKKCSRLSLGSSPTKKSISRMTKFELKAELQALKRTQAQSNRRYTSPLTELDDDDEVLTTHLREEIKERDEELQVLRNQLEAARRNRSNDIDGEIGSARESSPEITMRLNNADFTSPPLSMVAVPARRYPTALMRTQSGSFISNISKRPTPAPSSPERDVNDDALNGDISMDSSPPHTSQPHASADINHRSAINSTGLNTSSTEENVMSTLQPRSQIRNVQGDLQVASLKSEVENLRMRLANDAYLISTGKLEIARLTEAKVTSEAFVAARDATIRRMQEIFGATQAELTEAQLSRKKLEEELVEAEKTIGGMDAKLAATNDELGLLRLTDEARRARIENLVESLAEAANDAQILREEVTVLQQSISSSFAQAKEKTRHCELVQNQLHEKEHRIARLDAQLQSATESTQELSESLLQAEAASASAVLDLAEARGSVEIAESQLAEVTGRCRHAEEESLRISKELAEREEEVERVQEISATAQSKLEALTIDSSLKDDMIQRQRGDIHVLNNRISICKESLEEAEKRHDTEKATLSSQLLDLRLSLASAREYNDRMCAQLVSVQGDLDNSKETLAKVEAELATKMTILDGERRANGMIEADLVAYVEKNQGLEEELRSYRTSKDADDATISKLCDSFGEFHASQLRIFGDLEKVISAARSAPVPVPSRQTTT